MTRGYIDQMTNTPDEWTALTARIARSVQTTVGWIFWDPGAVSRFETLGLPGPLGYMASRAAPFAGAGHSALVAAFGSISPLGLRFVVDLLDQEGFMKYWHARNEAIVEGLAEYAPEMSDILKSYGPVLWEVVNQLPFAGLPYAASHLDLPMPDDPTLQGWHAVNVLREWRGDTHWGIIAELNLNGPEASTLHNAWLRYDGEWLSHSRGIAEEEIHKSLESLERRGLVSDGAVNESGIVLRDWIEQETDRRTTVPWQLLGYAETERLASLMEPPCERLLHRVDVTAGPRYQPASRIR